VQEVGADDPAGERPSASFSSARLQSAAPAVLTSSQFASQTRRRPGRRTLNRSGPNRSGATTKYGIKAGLDSSGLVDAQRA